MIHGFFDYAVSSPTGSGMMSGYPYSAEIEPKLLTADIPAALRSYVEHCRSIKQPILGGRVFVRFERSGETRTLGPETVERLTGGCAVAILPEGEYQTYEEALAALHEILPS